ncbi:trithorax group protein osa-like isoform X9 [Ostrea edulis]|uniref:trithorax group protein osa-like isoform X9 n=1 Tax=Ostrea edulis TaxID=37623 RepID=UPI0024AFAFD5|nr:trithorax group protein osa-like isoform X9 [Ostrea edulis]
MMNKKLRSPNQVGETNTMDSFQDGGQQNMNSTQNDFMEGSHLNADMNSYPPSSISMEGYGRMNQNVHPSQMQGYSPYNRENFNPGDQHGGTTGSSDYMNQNASFQGQYPRQGMPVGMKPGMRAGMGNPGGPMMTPYQQRMSGQSISQQSGPTPTLNQLLQTQSTSSTSQRMQPNNYSEYPQKGMNDMNSSAFNMQQPWGGHQRPMGYHPGSMNSPGPGFRGQNMSDMNQPRPGYSPSNYQMPPQNQYSAGQYSPNSRYGNVGALNRPGPANMPNTGFGHPNPQMSSGQPPGMTPPPSGGMASPMPNDSPHHRQASPSPLRRQPTPTSRSSSPQNTPSGAQQQQPSPSGSSSSWSGVNANGSKKNAEDGDMDLSGCDDVTSCDNNSQGLPTSNSPHPSISSLRPIPSPVGSSGSRSNTPASLPGTQAGSPMPPRPPSQHDSNQSSRMTQSPMATSYNQQMMPPPMGPNQVNYGPGGGKMVGNMPGPMNQGFPQYNSHYPQGNYSGRPGMPQAGGVMQNYPMYNGPTPGAPSGGAPNMYNNMPMNRNSNYNPYGGQNNMMSGMSNYNSGMSDMANGPRPPTPGTPGSGGSNSKSAKAAAQAALIAAASQQRVQQPTGRSNIPPAQVMYGQSGPHPVYPGGMTNSHSPVPNSVGPNSIMPNSSSAPNMSDSSVTHNSLPPSQDSSNPQSNGPPSNSYGSPSSVSSTNEKMPSQQNIPPSKKQNMQRDSSISSSSNDNVTSSSEMTASNNNDSSVPPQSGSMDSKEPQSGTPPNQGLPPESLGADSNLSSLTDTSSQGGDVLCNEQKDVEMPCIPDQSNLPPNAMKQEMPITTTATTNTMEKNIVTQVNTSPVMSTTEVSSDGHGHILANPQQQPAPPNPMPTLEEAVPDKKKKEGVSSHPPTPASLVAPSPGSASVSSFHEEFDNITSPPIGSNWANQTKGGDVNKLYEMGSEPDRRYFLNRLLSFLEDRNAPLNNMPSISKQPLDLYRLYLHVQEKGGMVEVTKAKKWKEICGLINIGSSASAAFTLKKNYIKYLFHYECQFERGGMDPGPILAHMEAQLAQKRESKKSRAPSPGKKEKAGSQGSQDAFRPPSNSNANQGMDGFPGNMPNQGYDPNMGPMMPGMMPQGQMMNNMMPPNSMGGMGHQMMHPGMMGNNYNMRPGMMNPNMMPHNNMMGMPPGGNMGMSQNNMGIPGNNMGMQGGGVRMPHGNNMGMPNSSMGGMNSGNNMGMPPQNNIGMGHGNSMGMPPGNNMGMPPQNNMSMGPGNNMAVPPSGNHMPMPSSRGNVPPSSTNQVIPPVNGDSISCQDPFADDMNNSGFINSGQPNSQGSSYSGMPPNSSAGNFKPNMPPNSMAQNVPSSTISQTSTPLNSSIPSHNSMGPSMIPNNMGPNATPSSMSPMLSGSGASNVPPNSMGQPMPPSSMSQSMPPNSSGAGQPLPPSSIGQSMPPSSTGQPMPPSSMGQQMPPNSVGHSMPPNSMGQSAPASSMDLSMANTSVPPNSVSHGIMTQNNMSQNLPSNVSMGMTPSSMPQTFNNNMSQCGPPSSIGQSMPPNSSSQNMPNFQPNMENPMSAFTPESSIPFSNYQANNSQDGDLSQGSTSNMSTPSLSSGRNFPFGENQFNKPERFDSPNPVQSVTPTPTPPPQRQPTPQSSTSLQQQPPTPLQPPPPQDSTFSQNRYGNQPPSMMTQGPQPHMGGPPHDAYTHNYPHQQGYSTPNKMMGGPPEQYGGFPSQYQNFPNQRPTMRNDMGMYGTPSKRFPDQYPNQDSRPNNQWSPMQRYSHGPHSMGMSPAQGMPPHMAPGPFQRGHNRMSPTPSHKQGSYMSPPKMLQKMPPNQIPKKEIPFPHDSVEATTPNYFKRRRLTRSDVGPIEAWRVMMGLKSGLLAESTWALDTLNILLYDDATVQYFNLAHLPGMLEALLEHFRKSLISIFGDMFEEMEKMSDEADEIPNKNMINIKMEEKVAVSGEEFTNYTYISRKGKEVKMEENNHKGVSPLDCKEWDIYSGYSYKYGHWQLGGGDLSSHIVPCFGSSSESNVYRRLFFRPPMELKDKVNISEEKNFVDTDNSKDLQLEEDRKVDDQKENENQIGVEDQKQTEGEKQMADQKEMEDQKEIDGQKELDGQIELRDSIKVKEEEHVKNHIIKKVKIKEEPIEEDEKQQGIQEDKDCDVENKENNGCDDEKMDESMEEKSEVKSENVKTEIIASDDNVVKQESDTEKCTTERVGLKRKLEIEQEDEAYQKDEPPLRLISDMQEELGRRCVCISNIFRSLSSIPSNHLEFSKHPGLMYTLGKLLKLNHRHLPRNTTRKKFDRDDSELEDISDSHLQQNDEEWWWEYFSMLRENTLVIFANICGHLELKYYPEEICMPILDGLLHWAVCPSSCATDPLPSTTTSVLSPQRLVLEALSKLCIHETNVDLLLATPPFDRIVQLFSILTKLLANKSEQVTLEFALVLLSSLVQGDTSCARAVAMQHPSISLLLDFLETAEHKAMTVANHHGINALRENPEIMGTSLDMLRRAANILLNLASVPENRPMFTQHQQRLLSLVMSQILDQFVAQILSDVLYQCFQDDLPSS